MEEPTFYGYDSAGQMIGRGTTESVQQISWTPFGKISQMWTGTGEPDDGLGVVTFGYDADGERVLKTTEDETTTYMLGLYERRERMDETEHVFHVGNDRRVFLQIAVRTDGEISEGELAFMHGDVVGSPEVITGIDGSVVDRRSYSAFGAERDPNDWNDPDSDTSPVRRGFTGHEEDREYNLVNMIGRLYDARIGRFLSADPFGTMASSQHLNHYSYVRNNPLKYVDPSGYAEMPPEPVDSGEPDFNYSPSDGSDAEYEQWQSDAQADIAQSETGSDSTPFSDPDAAANADATISDSAGTGHLSEALDYWAEGANIVMNDALDLSLDLMEATLDLCPSSDCQNSIRTDRAEQQSKLERQINRTEGGGTFEGSRLITNPKHHPRSKSPQPPNTMELFERSIPSGDGRRWAKDADGVIHRFSRPSNGETHWNGSTAGDKPILEQDIPIEIKRAFDL